MAAPRANIPTEVHLHTSEEYGDAIQSVEVDAIFRSADGDEWRIPAFWRGGRRFSARFAPPAAGDYTYRTQCSNPDDSSLHGRSGDLRVLPPDPDMDQGLYGHGRLRVADSETTLEHLDGTPFFWLADTWWMGTTKRLTWPDGFNMLAADRVQKGFSVIQIVLGPLPDFDAVDSAWHPQQANEGGWPWELDWARINPAYYDHADVRIAALVEQGLVPCIVGMWGFYLPFMGVERVRQHWRNLVARYAAYPVVWCVAGEVDMPTYSVEDREIREEYRRQQRQGWTEVTRYLRDLDPFRNPITAHPSRPDSRAMIEDDSLLDIDMLQTGHSGYASLKPSVDILYDCLGKEPAMPVLNSEACYEGIMGGSQQEVQRFLFWTSVLSGAAGHTYGAQGIWAMSSRDEPFVGWTASWGDAYWQDAMRLPGSGQVGLARRFLGRFPWWEFEPRVPDGEELARLERAGREYAFAAGVPGRVWLFYLAPGCMDTIFRGYQQSPFGGANEKLVIAIEPGVMYGARFLNPRTGAECRSYHTRGGFEVTLGTVVPNADGLWDVPPKPTMEDWVLVLEVKSGATLHDAPAEQV